MVVGADGKAARRKIETNRTNGPNSVVTSGLQRGDKVIVQGLNGLKQGAEIKAVLSTAPQEVKPQSGKPGAAKGH